VSVETTTKATSKAPSAPIAGTQDDVLSSTPTRAILGSELLSSLLDAKFFLVSAMIGFVTCCCLGYLAGNINQFGKIARFGLVLGPEASFFPTIRQFVSFVLSNSGDKTIVLVGGSSILNGVGQSSQELWTKKLQEKLGNRYSVMNLGLRSCGTYEGGYFVAEALSMQSKKVIFVTGSPPSGTISPLGFPIYAHLYWDAKYHHLLYDFPEREQAIAESEKALPDEQWTPDKLNELKLSRLFNSLLNFSDFWNTVGYRYFYTIYSPATASAPFSALRRLPETESFERFPTPEPQLAMNTIRSNSSNMFDWDKTEHCWQKNTKAWDGFTRTIRTNVAPQVRPNTLMLLLYYNPKYRSQLTPSERERDELSYEAAQTALKNEGVQAVRAGNDYTPEDFRDTKHLSPSGGARLANQVADEVERMAQKLRYEN
jgi:lysophospholipase L1-like esterase